MMADAPATGPAVLVADRRIGDGLAALFAGVIVLYAAGGPIADLVGWIVETTTPGFEEMSRRDQRVLSREHPLGAAWRAVERGLLRPTGLILGLPILLGLVIGALDLGDTGGVRWLNRALAVAAAASVGVWMVQIFGTDAGLLPSAGGVDYALFPLAAGIALYLTWRMYGAFIAWFCVFWLVYLFARGVLPDWTGILAGSEASAGQNLRAMVQNFWAQTGGMFGQPIQVVAGNVLIFIVFGAVMVGSGAGALLLKLANLLTGGLRGGAAHAAVAASALFGTLSGAAISNVVSTGVMTIPVIKRAGFRPAFAGAVEAASSTGGQVMPPVMGVVAFFVAGQIGLEYRYIVVAAILPALLFYLGLFLSVYFEARRAGIGALPLAERPGLTRREGLQCLVFVIPLGVLSTALFVQPSVPKAGFLGFAAALVTALALFPDFRSRARLWAAFVKAGRMSAGIVVIVAAIGLIVGLIQLSGFAGRLSLLLSQLADGPLLLVLVVLALGSIVLGMGLPPGATYFIIVVALSSGIDAVGLPPLTLHLFVVFFAVMSTVTPPVALAAFAAAPIAGADPMRTGLAAARIGFAGFLIPFAFAYHPALLYKLQMAFAWFGAEVPDARAMMDPAAIGWGALAWILAALGLALWLVASGLAGYDRTALTPAERALRIVLAVAMLVPEARLSVPAMALAAALLGWHASQARAPGAGPRRAVHRSAYPTNPTEEETR